MSRTGTERLLRRLEEIGQSLGSTGEAVMLLGLGSVGPELERLDAYSDLDFFVIARPGFKSRFIDELDWLEAVHPLAYHFRNTDDGHKILFEDGIYGEFAVFEERELEGIGYFNSRVVWKDAAQAGQWNGQAASSAPMLRKNSLEFPLNEALTNLYVGLCRYARGEKLSAVRFVQSYAVDSLLSVLHLLEQEVDYYPDPYGNERRLEVRFPVFAQLVGGMLQGYDRVPESALCILDYLERVYEVNRSMSGEIRRLAQSCMQQ